MSENLGVLPCLLCAREVPVTEQKNGKAMLHCQWCGCQVYARGMISDELLRKKMTAAPAAAPGPIVKPDDGASVAPPAPAKPKPQYDAAGRRIAS